MKFIPKIAVFLALLLISKYTKETGALTSTKEKIQPNAPSLAIYNQQGAVPDKLEEEGQKKTLAIYK